MPEENELMPVLTSLRNALSDEEARIYYYDKLLTSINNESIPQAVEAVNQAREWSLSRGRLLLNAINALIQLIENKYPERKENMVAAEVLMELEDIMVVLTGIKSELKEIPTAELVVGDPDKAL